MNSQNKSIASATTQFSGNLSRVWNTSTRKIIFIVFIISLFASILTTSVATAATSNELTTGLISYWKLDETTGTRIDAHGTNDLNDVNTVLPAVGKLGNAADFERNNDEYFTHSDNADFSSGDIDFSFVVWVNIESKPAEATTIFAKGDSARNREYQLMWSLTMDRLIFQVMDGSGSIIGSIPADSLGSPVLGTWYMIYVYHDATANQVGISVNDGVVDTAGTTGVISDTVSSFRVGKRFNFTEQWDGLIDEFGFWKRVLTTQELTDLYNNGAGFSYPFIPATPTPTATATTAATSTPNPTNTATATYTATFTPTATSTPQPTPTNTPTVTTIPPQAPVAVANSSLDADGLQQLDGTASSDSDGSTVDFTWQIVGEASTRNGELASVSNLTPGDYIAELTVTDNDGLTGTDTTLFSIAPVDDNPRNRSDKQVPHVPHATLNKNPAGSEDTVSGDAGSVDGSLKVSFYADADLTELIAFTIANEDGSFDPVNIGDDAYDTVYVIASNKAGVSSQVQRLRNDPVSPGNSDNPNKKPAKDASRDLPHSNVTVMLAEVM